MSSPLYVIAIFYNNRWHYLDGIKHPNTDGWTHDITEAFCLTSPEKADTVRKRYLENEDFIARFGEPEVLAIGSDKTKVH